MHIDRIYHNFIVYVFFTTKNSYYKLEVQETFNMNGTYLRTMMCLCIFSNKCRGVHLPSKELLCCVFLAAKQPLRTTGGSLYVSIRGSLSVSI